MTTLTKTITLTVGSPAFEQEGFIPSRYTCEGRNVNPPITIGNIPEGTKSLALIVDDPDAPGGVFDHWIIWNIAPIGLIIENSTPGIEGKNTFGKAMYQGPCPPSGAHRYFFKIYAIDTLLDLKEGADKETLEKAMKEHIIGTGELIGIYRKSK